MFGMGWPEILLIAVVAVIVIGPKDMPDALRAAGRVVYKVRKFMRNMQKSLDEVAQDAELDEIIKEANVIGEDHIDAELEKQAQHRARMATDPDYAAAYQEQMEHLEHLEMMPISKGNAKPITDEN